MRTYNIVILSAWASGWIAHAATKVGTVPDVAEYTWGLPLSMALFMFVPAVCGYLIGAEK